MKAVLFDDPLHTANADLPAALAELLGNHFGRGVRVEEALPNHLADHFRRASVMGLRTALVALPCLRAVLGESGPQLKVALLAEAELPRGLKGAESLALPLD